MKRNLHRIGICMAFLLCASGLLVGGCTDKKAEEEQAKQLRQENVESQEQVRPLMKECGLSNLDIFWEWALDSEDVTKKKQDSNSRMTAFLLLQDMIQADERTQYGDFLAEEVAQIQTDDRYEVLRSDLSTYLALFDEVSVGKHKNNQEYKQAYIKAWEKRGVRFSPGKAHLLSVVTYDPENKKQNIAHAAVMLEDNKGFLLIEKRGSFQQYMISYFVSKKELQATVMGRKEYITMEKSNLPFLLEDNRLFETE